MKKGDKAKKVLDVILILAVIVSVFGGAVSAEDLSGGLKQSVDDAEIQTAVGDLSSEELTKALDADLLHQLPSTSGEISCFCPDCCPTSAWGEPLGELRKSFEWVRRTSPKFIYVVSVHIISTSPYLYDVR